MVFSHSCCVWSLISLSGVRRCEDGCPSTPWSACVSAHSPTLTFSMNGDMPHVPITTLAGIASLTDCEWFPPPSGSTLNLLTELYLFLLALSFSSPSWLFPHLFPQCWTSCPSPLLSPPPPLRASYTMGGSQRTFPASWVVEMRIWHPS